MLISSFLSIVNINTRNIFQDHRISENIYPLILFSQHRILLQLKIEKLTYLLGIFVFLVFANVNGQIRKDAFQTARSLAFAGEYQKSIEICDSIIKKQPKNFDVRILQARVVAWNKQLDSSRTKCKQLN